MKTCCKGPAYLSIFNSILHLNEQMWDLSKRVVFTGNDPAMTQSRNMAKLQYLVQQD